MAPPSEPIRHSFSLRSLLTETSHARELVLPFAMEAGFSEERRFDIQVAISEACANAIEHSLADSEVEFVVLVYPDRLEIQVEGRGEFELPAAAARERVHRGLGLPLMAKLSDHMSLYSGPRGGTLVALTFYRPGFRGREEADEITPPWIRELVEENELVAEITGAVPVGLYVVDPELRYRWANAAYQKFLEEPYRSQPLEGVHIGDTVPGFSSRLEVLRRATQGERAFFPECEHVGFARGITYWCWEVIPLKQDRPGPPYDVLTVISEITEQVLQRRKVEAASRNYAALAENSGLALALCRTVFDEEGAAVDFEYFEVNEVHHAFTGYPAETFVGKRVTEAMPGYNRELIDRLNRVALTGEPSEEEIYEPHVERWYRLNTYSPEPGYFVSLARDITSSKQAEEALCESEERFRLLVEQAPDGIFLADTQGRYTDANTPGLEMLGYTLKELQQLRVTDVIVPEEVPRMPEQMESLAGGAVPKNEWLFRRKDGSTFTGEVVGRQLPDGRLLGILRDVTGRRRAEEAWRRSEERLSRSQEIAHLGSWELDLIRNELTWSDEVYRIFGLEPQEFGATYEAFLERVHPDDRQKVDEAYTSSLRENRDAYEIEHRVVRKDSGEVRTVHEKCQHFRDATGSIVRSVGMVHDVTERKRAEEALRTSAEHLQRELKTSRILLQTAEALSELTDLRSVLHALTEAVIWATSHTRATFALWDEAKGQVQVVASSGDEAIPPLTAAVEQFSPPFQHVVESRETMLADYDALPQEQTGMARAVHSRMGLLVPLTYRQRLVGGLFVDDPGKRGEFPAEEMRLIEGIAAQAAVAVENARLYEAQSSIATTLQQALFEVPIDIPGIHVGHLYRSATEAATIGGDFYDMIDLKGDGYILLIGDVSGHGIEAARSATFVRDAVVAFESEGKDPQEMLQDTNKALLRRGMAGFVTLLLAHLSPDRRSISFCSAGHPHMLLRRRNAETTVASMTHHPPLGVFSDWSCTVERLPLSPGDVLLFYTDGVTEARANGELFGEDRVVEWLGQRVDVPVDELPSALLAEVLAFSGGTLRDDVAIMAIEIEA